MKQNLKSSADVFPGRSVVKAAVKKADNPEGTQHEPRKSSIGKDITAGVTVSLNDAPDGLASALLVGVSPIMGLYASIFGPLVGGMLTGSKLMIISTTSAAAFVLGQLIIGYPDGQRISALLLTVVMSGIFMLIFGLLKLGKAVRYVSYSVMTGFLYGIAVLTILSQLPTIFGIAVGGRNKILQTVDMVANVAETQWPTLFTGLLTLILLIALAKTVIGKASGLVAVAIPSILVLLLNWNSVELVENVSEIPTGFPDFWLPDLSVLSTELVLGALSLAAVVLIQSAGIGQSVPNPDGAPNDVSRDFVAQGAANIASGLFGGIAVGGALGSTAMNVMYGARTRLASLTVGISILVLVLLFPGLLAKIAMPVLAMIMVYASAGAIKVEELKQLWHINWGTRILALSTFVATLILPVQFAILIGIVISVVVYFATSSREVHLNHLQILADGRFEEVPVPDSLSGDTIYILEVSGAIHFAGARAIEEMLPMVSPTAKKPVVILRLKDRDTLAATFVEVLESYAAQLEKAGGSLYLSGLSEKIYIVLQKMQKIHILENTLLYPETKLRGDSTRKAFDEAKQRAAQRAPTDASES